MIELGLSRISQLVQQSPPSWRAIHIAGTNGKGSITAYLSGMLTAGGLRCGRFTSPHLIDRWDCITVSERAVQESLFRQVEDQIKHRDSRLQIGATEFELLTATAFEIFNRERVDVGVVEVGVGGRLDATNSLRDVVVSVISKIGLDHQALLGGSIKEIAREKSGILKPGVPCVIDGTNSPEALQVLELWTQELGIDAILVRPDEVVRSLPALSRTFKMLDLEPHQEANMSCAVAALQVAIPHILPGKQVDDLLPQLSRIHWPGRLQQITLDPLVARREPVLLDGAHNAQSAEALGKHVDRKLRSLGHSVTWIIAASHGKNLSELLQPLVRSGDNVGVVAFGSVDGMPWVKATDPTVVSAYVQSIEGVSMVQNFDTDIPTALNWANVTSDGGPLVIAGSLYLVSDVLRLLRGTRDSLNETDKKPQ
jgi:folylpolyglutamate synthase